MNYEERKRELKEDLDHLKHEFHSIKDDELLMIYEQEINSKSLELEEIKLRIMYLRCN